MFTFNPVAPIISPFCPTETGKTGESTCAQMKIATSLVAQFGGQLKDGRLTLNLSRPWHLTLEVVNSTVQTNRRACGTFMSGLPVQVTIMDRCLLWEVLL